MPITTPLCLPVLAQSTAASVTHSSPTSMSEAIKNFFDVVAGMFSKGDALAQPDHVIQHLSSLGAVWAVIFVIVGVMCMLNGYRFYRAATIGVALLLGMFAGYWFGSKIGAPYIVAACLGVLMATLAFPLMKYAVALMGGLTGAFVGANLWAGMADAINTIASEGSTVPQYWVPSEAYWLGAFLGLLICGMLAFILFKLSVVWFTSVSGSTLAVMGAIALLLSFEPWQATVTSSLRSSNLVIPLLVFVPAMIGLIMQQTQSRGLVLDIDGDHDE
ncbi:MAG: hypothetical protein V3V20_11110 [Algisphaera sp.]